MWSGVSVKASWLVFKIRLFVFLLSFKRFFCILGVTALSYACAFKHKDGGGLSSAMTANKPELLSYKFGSYRTGPDGHRRTRMCEPVGEGSGLFLSME